MQRINVGFWYYLAKTLSDASRVELDTAKPSDLWAYYQADQALQQLEESKLLEITTSRAACSELRSALQTAQQSIVNSSKRTDEDASAGLERYWLGQRITTALDTLEKVLQEELKIADVYSVSQKRIYSTRLLIDKAEEALGDDARAVVSEQVRKDLREAGRCLAFELPTAAGIHAMRAAEKVLRDWYEEVTTKRAARIQWSVAIARLKEAGESEATLVALDRVRDLHRNPLAHPGEFLSLDEALEVFGAAETAINAVARQIKHAREKRFQRDGKQEPAQGFSQAAGEAASPNAP